MKIALIADSFLLDQSTGVNGTQVQMYNLALAFTRRNHEVYFISLTKDKFVIDAVINGIYAKWIQHENKKFSWIKEIRIYQDILNEIQPDVVYQRGRAHLTYIASKWAKTNEKKFIWGSNGEDACDFWKRIKRQKYSQRSIFKKIILYPLDFIQDLLIHYGIRNADIVVNQTEYQKKRLMDNYGKIGIILPSYFFPIRKTKQKKEKLVLWMANLSPGKQPELFIHLAKQCQQYTDWEFILAGGTKKKEYWEQLCDMALDIKNLTVVGAVPFDQTNEYYARSALFVNTSQRASDGVPNAFIQAWLNGTPVLSLNHDPNGWIKNYNLGICANGNNASFFKEASSLIKNHKRVLSLQKVVASFSRRKFSDSETISNYLSIFSDKVR